MSDLRVPTLRHAVTITCADGRTFEGHIFLPSQSSRTLGPMSAEEWSDTVPTFVPFRATDAGSSTIVSVDAHGLMFEDQVTIDMPPDRQRVVDWLNAPATFFTVRDGEIHHLIQKRHVTRVVELERTPA